MSLRPGPDLVLLVPQTSPSSTESWVSWSSEIWPRFLISLVFEGRVPTVALGKRSLTKADFPSETEVLGNRVPSVYHTIASSEPEVDLATGTKCPRNER